ncbi:Stem-specific protein TSJT1, partial [Mucuna pruriens]
MLAVFQEYVAKSPEALQIPHSNSVSALEDGFLAQHFSSVHPGSVIVNLGSSGLLAYSLDKQNPLLPRLFAVVDNIFCLFQGHLENVANLKQQYGLNKTANEGTIIIEAYRTLRDRGPYPAAQVVRDFQGKFAFILYDCGSETAFVAANDRGIPFVWGTDADGNLVFSDEKEIVTKSCGKSSAPFPEGFFFTTSGGLSSFEHPLNGVRSIPRYDENGNEVGANFLVDFEVKKETTGMPRVGSAANWSNNI